MINFDEAPKNNPFSIPEPGYYRFLVKDAEMRQPRDPQKPPYLSTVLQLTDTKGHGAGNLFDRFFDSDAPIMQYKLKRFVEALGLKLSGQVELSDIRKMIVGRRGVVEVENVQDSRFPDDDTKVQAQTRIFGSECYWAEDQYASLVGETEVAAPQEDNKEPEPPFDMGDPSDEY